MWGHDGITYRDSLPFHFDFFTDKDTKKAVLSMILTVAKKKTNIKERLHHVLKYNGRKVNEVSIDVKH